MNIKTLFRMFPMLVLMISTGRLSADDQWVVYDGHDGPGKGKHRHSQSPPVSGIICPVTNPAQPDNR